mmetsp:Transcript_29028/g.42687  ORF Transcript_29028/g.42687 Transcript_29028/m.42687 type:complete len:134 (-) Transcript_29028:247-648(-)|eukprot:CAMPEP_0194028396 /NCGR_PEP_ID=MMETSP0009_2-20130614/2373_1 /TAXON_ID=210454 /ORGANISM="Grammatophora oceanica, Strain CCMP 410" /LENGTH=133 /DNA_ID=CAMNT_0038667779 /DNA_START=194 /DNA_END=595 /DNA_ORIENTATION=+
MTIYDKEGEEVEQVAMHEIKNKEEMHQLMVDKGFERKSDEEIKEAKEARRKLNEAAEEKKREEKKKRAEERLKIKEERDRLRPGGDGRSRQGRPHHHTIDKEELVRQRAEEGEKRKIKIATGEARGASRGEEL